MLDQFFGLILLGLGLGHPMMRPNVLGDQTQEVVSSTGSAERPPELKADTHSGSGRGRGGENPRPTLRVLAPVLTKKEEDAFQEDRAAREAKILKVTDAKVRTLEDEFTNALHKRAGEDEASHTGFLRKVEAFKDSGKKQRVLSVADKFRSTVTNALTSMQKKLASMTALLDKISVSAAALKAQGKDVSGIDSDITAAQAKVATAQTLLTTLTGSISTVLPVTSETSAGEDAGKAIGDAKTKLGSLYAAFVAARKAVGVALDDVESLTKPVEVTPTP